MPIQKILPTGLAYYLLSLSAKGDEVPEADGTLLSEGLLSRLSEHTPAVTDVFLICHGWNTSAAAAVNAYEKWMDAMADDGGGLAEAAAARRGAFTPLLVGLRWPSKFLDAGGDHPSIVNVAEAAAVAARDAAAADAASADAEAGVHGGGGDSGGGGGGGGGGAGADAAAVAATVAVLLAALEEEDAQGVADDPAAMAAFTTLAKAMVTSEGAAPVWSAASAVAAEQGGQGNGGGGGTGLPTPVLNALVAVQRALSPTEDDAGGGGGAPEGVPVDAHGNGGGGAQPGQPDVDAANAAFHHAVLAAANVEIMGDGLAWPTQMAHVMLPVVEIVFGSFARRAAALGRGPVAALLRKFRRAAAERGGGAVHFHGVGHSLGAHLLLAAAVSPSSTSSGLSSSSKGDAPSGEAALQSLSLLQGAVPATALHAGGAYAGAHEVVDGPIVVTRSAHDRALVLYRAWYGPPLGLEGCTPPPHLQPPADPVPLERVMVAGGGGAGGGVAGGAVRQDYDLRGRGAVVNVDAAAVINQVDGWWDLSGAHGDIVHDEVVHLVWEAVLATLW